MMMKMKMNSKQQKMRSAKGQRKKQKRGRRIYKRYKPTCRPN